MDVAAIGVVTKKSAEQYYKYMDSQEKPADRGETYFSVRKIDSFGHGVIMIHLYNSLNDISLARLEIHGQKIDDALYSFRSYDDITKTLEMKASESIETQIKSCDANDVRIVHDFKFLIKRIHDYLEEYWGLLAYPCEGAMDEQDIIISSSSSPSDSQKEAIITCLTEPSSYIWGAPGTGKTQYVLTNSIVNDIRMGKKVAVFAPTNTSVEQVLLGLIKEIKHNPDFSNIIDLDKDVLRVGVPSLQFATNYPSMCERGGRKTDRKVLKRTIEALEETRDEMMIDGLESDFKKFLELEEEYSTASKQRKEKIEEYYILLIDKTKQIKTVSGAVSNASILNMWGSAREIIDAAYQRPRPRRFLQEYSHFTVEDMDELINKQKTQLNGMAGSDRKRRFKRKEEVGTNETMAGGASLDSAKLIVCTPHQFVHRMVPSGASEAKKHVLDVGHIYVDEVGYSNLMTIIPLFTNHCPITFLGDHMQLDPVFTMDRRKAIEQIDSRGEYCHVFLWGTSAIHLEEMFFSPDLSSIQNSFINGREPPFNHMKLSVLRQSFRFGDNLARILDENVYGNIGLTGASEAGALVIKCFDLSDDEDGKYLNPLEAEAILDYLDHMTADDGTVAVLAPYNKQVAELKGRIGKKNSVDVMTIHKSQGREWDTVIISVTNNNPDDNSFMNTKDVRNLRLINTAVSRAKKQLIIFCDYEKWSGRRDQLISRLVDHAKKNGELYDAQ